jgi:hypothetical protein
MDPLLDFTAFAAHVDNEVRAVGEGEYLPEGHFDWRAARAFYRGYAELQPRLPAKLGIPAALVFGAGDALVAGSVSQNRQRLEEMGFVITPAEGYDHQTCVEAVGVVTRLAAPVLEF